MSYGSVSIWCPRNINTHQHLCYLQHFSLWLCFSYFAFVFCQLSCVFLKLQGVVSATLLMALGNSLILTWKWCESSHQLLRKKINKKTNFLKIPNYPYKCRTLQRQLCVADAKEAQSQRERTTWSSDDITFWFQFDGFWLHFRGPWGPQRSR